MVDWEEKEEYKDEWCRECGWKEEDEAAELGYAKEDRADTD